MFESLRKMWKITELRKKLIYTFLMLLLYCLVGQIYAPGINIGLVRAFSGENTLMGMLNMMTGGMTTQMTIMAMKAKFI